MTINKTISLVLTATFFTAASVLATEVDSAKVKIETPDDVLLEGINFEEMAKVKQPSATLTMTIEEIPYEIDVKPENDVIVLQLPEGSENDAEDITKTYKTVMNSVIVEVEFEVGSDSE